MKAKDKRELVGRFVEIPRESRRPFWAKEMTILKLLADRYSWEFLFVLSIQKKFASLAVLAEGPMRKEMDKRWKIFNSPVDDSRYPTYDLSPKKEGEDREVPKQKTLREFLS